MGNKEQAEERDLVWEEVARKHAEFLRAHDPTGNWYTVREIVLGGSVSWAGANARFQPFPGARIMDLGANVGIYTAFCALRGAHVTAYEPDPVTFSVLAGMVKSTNLGSRIAVVNAAVWSSTGRFPFRGFAQHLDGSFESHNGTLTAIGGEDRQWGHSREVETVNCISFDEAIGEKDWDCLKIDIEGAEYEMLLAASPNALQRVKFAYIEFHPWVSADVYEQTIIKLKEFFEFEGAQTDGKWDYAYLRRKAHGN